MTSSQSGYDPREPAQRAGLLRGDQVGERLWMYAWYHFADVKNSKLFLEPWDRGKSRGRFQRQRVILREPEGRVEVLRR